MPKVETMKAPTKAVSCMRRNSFSIRLCDYKSRPQIESDEDDEEIERISTTLVITTEHDEEMSYEEFIETQPWYFQEWKEPMDYSKPPRFDEEEDEFYNPFSEQQ
jgi:hypothetical protein